LAGSFEVEDYKCSKATAGAERAVEYAVSRFEIMGKLAN
jgi:hypothetical protein